VLDEGHQKSVLELSQKLSKGMNAALVFTSAASGVNVTNLFKVLVARVFGARCRIERVSGIGEAVLEY
jgi:hypothetical protein